MSTNIKNIKTRILTVAVALALSFPVYTALAQESGSSSYSGLLAPKRDNNTPSYNRGGSTVVSPRPDGYDGLIRGTQPRPMIGSGSTTDQARQAQYERMERLRREAQARHDEGKRKVIIRTEPKTLAERFPGASPEKLERIRRSIERRKAEQAKVMERIAERRAAKERKRSLNAPGRKTIVMPARR